MKCLGALVVLLIGTAGFAASVMPGPGSGVSNASRARVNWMLKCQGCHRPDASGSPETTPTMADEVARFLAAPEGRDYLARVPGVATAALPDDQLAELLNWTLLTFDSGHVPTDFKPYSPQEIGALRLRPLRTDAPAMRARIMAVLSKNKPQSEVQEGEFNGKNRQGGTPPG